MAKTKTLMDIFNDVAHKKFALARQDIKGRSVHFEEIMTDAMRIFNKRLKDRIRRSGFNSDGNSDGNSGGNSCGETSAAGNNG
jgi:hypothetical protein